VLREIVAAEQGTPAPAPSNLFTGDFRADPDSADWRLLPTSQVSTDDPAAGYLASLIAGDLREQIGLLRAAPEATVEVQLRLAYALIETSTLDEAERILTDVEASDPWEWRAAWLRGTAALAKTDPAAARAHFEAVYSAAPGELAPKLALGICAELTGEHTYAAGWYEVVSRTDPGYTTATFGLARCRRACGDRAGELAAYARIPESSSAHIDAQTAMIHCLVGSGRAQEAQLDDLKSASACIEALRVGPTQRASLTTELLRAALDLLDNDLDREDPGVALAGHRLIERDIRGGLEQTYRSLARVADSPQERVRLVDWANQARPRTWT
jgi:serine/threonine-protein kinase PknG